MNMCFLSTVLGTQKYGLQFNPHVPHHEEYSSQAYLKIKKRGIG